MVKFNQVSLIFLSKLATGHWQKCRRKFDYTTIRSHVTDAWTLIKAVILELSVTTNPSLHDFYRLIQKGYFGPLWTFSKLKRCQKAILTVPNLYSSHC